MDKLKVIQEVCITIILFMGSVWIFLMALYYILLQHKRLKRKTSVEDEVAATRLAETMAGMRHR